MEDYHINTSGPAWRQVGFWSLVAVGYCEVCKKIEKNGCRTERRVGVGEKDGREDERERKVK